MGPVLIGLMCSGDVVASAQIGVQRGLEAYKAPARGKNNGESPQTDALDPQVWGGKGRTWGAGSVGRAGHTHLHIRM